MKTTPRRRRSAWRRRSFLKSALALLAGLALPAAAGKRGLNGSGVLREADFYRRGRRG